MDNVRATDTTAVSVTDSTAISITDAADRPSVHTTAAGKVGTILVNLGPIPNPPLHPDGALGRPSAAAGIEYNSVYRDGCRGGVDYQKYYAEFGLVPVSRVALHARYAFTDLDPARHLLLGGFSLYIVNPVPTERTVNADGPIWGPVLTLLGGARIPDHADSGTRALGDIRLVLPISSRLTVGGGYRWREEDTWNDPITGYGLVGVYLADYPADSAWANPDGPVGMPAFRLLAGAATDTWGVDLQLLAPLQIGLTLVVALGMERLIDPRRTVYVGNLGIVLYFLG